MFSSGASYRMERMRARIRTLPGLHAGEDKHIPRANFYKAGVYVPIQQVGTLFIQSDFLRTIAVVENEQQLVLSLPALGDLHTITLG